jgi:hypothetical protein
MPIYEYYCPGNHRIYQFYARTLAQGRTVPPCPDNPRLRMRRILSPFAMGAMEREFSGMDENDPRAMGRMMRRMADLSGEPIGGEMEEVVRKLEEGADPDSLEDRLGAPPEDGAGPQGEAQAGGRRGPRPRRAAPVRDPKLYDYP